MSVLAGVVGCANLSPDGGPIACPGSGRDGACVWYGGPYWERRRSLPSIKESNFHLPTPVCRRQLRLVQKELVDMVYRVEQAATFLTTTASPVPTLDRRVLMQPG